MNRTTLKDHAKDYLARRLREVGEATVANEESTLNKLTRWWDATRRSPRSLNAVDFEDFLDGPFMANLNRPGEEISNRTFNNKILHLREFLKWLEHRRVIQDARPMLDLLKERPVIRPNFVRLTIPQLHQVIEAADTEWERFVLSLAAFSFGRQQEVLTRKVGDFDLDAGLIQWYRPKTDDPDWLPIQFELDTAVRRWFIAYQEMCGPLDPTWYAAPRREGNGRYYETCFPTMKRYSYGELVQKNVALVLGVPVETLRGQATHILRRSAARCLYDALRAAGVADAKEVVRAMLGHQKVSTTELYIGIQADREYRDSILKGSRFMSLPDTNVVELRSVPSG